MKMRRMAAMDRELDISVDKGGRALDDYVTAFLDKVEEIITSVRRNEKLESSISRHDTDDKCEIKVLLSNHEAIDDIFEYVAEQSKALAAQLRLEVEYEFPTKGR